MFPGLIVGLALTLALSQSGKETISIVHIGERIFSTTIQYAC